MMYPGVRQVGYDRYRSNRNGLQTPNFQCETVRAIYLRLASPVGEVPDKIGVFSLIPRH